MGLLIEILEAVVAELNASGRPYSAAVGDRSERVYAIDDDLRSLAELKVRVANAKRETEETNRGKRKLTYKVDVGIQKKVNRADLTAESDPLLNLTEQIVDWFDEEDRELTTTSGVKARVTEVEAPLVPLYDHLVNKGVFTMIATLTIEAFG